MNHYLKFCIITSIALNILCACTSSNKKIEFLPTLDYEEPEIFSFQISEVLKPIDMVINDHYVCILNEEKQNGEQIYVFDAENLDFKYKFAHRGLGPEETIALDIVKTMRGDTIDLIDQANYKKLTYILTDSSPKLIKESLISIPNVGPLQETYWISDSILIFNTRNGDIITYNDNTNTIIDTANLSSLISGVDDEIKKKIGSFHFTVQGKEVVVGFRFFKQIIKFPLDSSFSFDISNLKPFSTENINFENLFNNHTFFSFLASNDNLVVAQYYGKTLKSLQPFPVNFNGQDLNYDIIILDRNLKPLNNYKIQMPVLRVFLDKKRKRVYFWNADDDFERLNYIQL